MSFWDSPKVTNFSSIGLPRTEQHEKESLQIPELRPLFRIRVVSSSSEDLYASLVKELQLFLFYYYLVQTPLKCPLDPSTMWLSSITTTSAKRFFDSYTTVTLHMSIM